MRHIIYRWIRNCIQSRGYDAYFADKITHELQGDLLHNKTTTLRQKLWALRRGFFSDKIALYGLTDENHTDFLPDLAYYKLFPINGMYGRWIDDKLTMQMILQPFAQ